jgi:cell division septum initiation protein DivIVA
VAKSPSEQVRDLALEVRAIAERERAVREYLADLKARDEKRERDIADLRKENAELRREVSDARQEAAVLKQQVAELTKQKDTGDARRWGVIVMFLSGLLSLATALVVALVRK